MHTPFLKGDRVRTRDGRTGTVYQSADGYWQTVGIEFDDDKGCVVQKMKTHVFLIREPAPAVSPTTAKRPLDLNLKLATVSRHTGETMRVGFWDRDDNEAAAIRATPAELQEFAIRILTQVQYVIEDR